MHPLAVWRIRAYLLDSLTYLAVAAGTLPIGLALIGLGLGADRPVVLLVSAIPPSAATVIASLQEAGSRHATWGKRRYGLVVTGAAGQPLTVVRALVRNTVKIGLPWQLGHVVAIGSRFGGFQQQDPLTWAAAAVTYPLLAVMVIAVTRGRGQALHDRVAGTQVLTTRW